MADIKEVYARSEEYQEYARQNEGNEPTVEKFLQSMSPADRAAFEEKYGKENDQPERNNKEDAFMAEYRGNHTEEEKYKLAENLYDKLREVDSLEKLETWFALSYDLVRNAENAGELRKRTPSKEINSYFEKAGFFALSTDQNSPEEEKKLEAMLSEVAGDGKEFTRERRKEFKYKEDSKPRTPRPSTDDGRPKAAPAPRYMHRRRSEEEGNSQD